MIRPVAALFLLLVSSVLAATQNNPWISALRGPEYSIDAGGDFATATIPVRIDSTIAHQEVSFTVRDVRMGTRADARWLDSAFVPSATPSGALRSITLRVNTSKADLQGKYLVLLEATTAGRNPVPLELTIVRPAAQLTVQPVKLERVLPQDGRGAGVLLIQERSGESGITGLKVQLPAFGDNRGATFKLNSPPTTLAPGGTDSIRYWLSEGLPLGTSKGVLRLSAPQLAMPVEVPVEVRTRATLWLLFGTILIGLVAGWAVRVWAERWIELQRLRLQGVDIRDRVARERDASKDPVFLAATHGSYTRLVNALEGRDSDELKKAAEDAVAVLDRELSSLEERLAHVTVGVKALEALNKDRFLPSALDAAVGSVGSDIASAQSALAERNASEADSHLNAARRKVAVRLRDEVEKWATSQTEALARLTRDDLPLPASVAASLRAASGRITPVLSGLVQLQPDAATAELASALNVVDGVRRGEREMLRLVGGWIREAAEDVVRELGRAPKPDTSAFRKLEEAANAFAAEVFDAAPDPERALGLLVGKGADALDHEFRTAIRTHLVVLDPTKKEPVEALLSVRNYGRAAEQAARLQQQASAPSAGTVLGGKRSPAATPPAEPEGVSDRHKIPSFGGWAGADGRVEVRTVHLRTPTEVIRARAKMEIAWTSLGRWAVLAVGLVALGMMFYGPSFVGTMPELASIFIWAFGLNVTADTLLAQGAKLKAG